MAWTERYVRSDAAGGGNGTTDTNSGGNGAWTLAEAITNVAAGHRVNIRAGTYSNTTTDRTFGTSGTTTAPIWWRGFNTTPGDIDTNNSLTKPAITFTTGRFIATGSFQIFSNLNISGAQTTNSQIRCGTGSKIWFDRCQIECTSANGNGRAFSVNGSAEVILTRCWIKASNTATEVIECNGQGGTFVGNVILGGGHGIAISLGIVVCVAFNTFDAGGDAVRVTNSSIRLWCIGNTIYSSGSDGFECTQNPTLAFIANNIITESGGYGINNSTGGNIASIFRLHNLYYSNTSGNENGLGDTPSVAEQTDTSSPVTSSSDMTPATGSNGIGNGIPIGFENTSYSSYLDIGAVQKQATGGGGLAANPLRGLIL